MIQCVSRKGNSVNIDKPTRIALKHIGIGFIALVTVLVVTQFLFPTNAGMIGATFAVMTGSVISASNEAYKTGRMSSVVK